METGMASETMSAPMAEMTGMAGMMGNMSADYTGLAPSGPYNVVVAPKQGDLRMVPFSESTCRRCLVVGERMADVSVVWEPEDVNVPEGQTITYTWGADKHSSVLLLRSQ